MNESLRRNAWYIVLIAVVAVLVISNVVTMVWLFSKMTAVKPVVDQPITNSVEPPTDGQIADEPTGELAIDATKGEIKIDWQLFQTEVNIANLIPYDFFDCHGLEYGNCKNLIFSEARYRAYSVGTVTEGTYKGDTVYLLRTISMDFGDPSVMSRVIKHENKLIFLAKYSPTLDVVFAQMAANKRVTDLIVVNNDLTIPGLKPSDGVAIPDSKYSLVRVDQENNYPMMMNEYSNLKIEFYDGDNRPIYYNVDDGCHYIAGADGVAYKYKINIGFVAVDTKTDVNAGTVNKVLDITWNDGAPNSFGYYVSRMTGCGSYGCYAYPEYIKGKSQLKKVGDTKNDGAVWEIDDPAAVTIKNWDGETVSMLKNVYDSYYPGYDEKSGEAKTKISYENFLKSHPVIYWQDPFGRWMEFTRADFLPAVECGKPVIYLYPEKEMDVKVNVSPRGGIKESIPNYNQGWSVKASPRSLIYNYADAVQYPYLFWEGYSYQYVRSNQGFVVKNSELERMLPIYLAKLGLQNQEITDFTDFWIPEMRQTDKPYYFITFVPKKQFDAMAPLSVDPKPDTIIRVFMDYQGLDKFVNVEAQRLSAPQRIGFTVVEWGGALHK